MIEHLYSALRSPYGIKVKTNNVERLRQRLYTLKKEDPQFSVLSLVPSPLDPEILWIVKRSEHNDGT